MFVRHRMKDESTRLADQGLFNDTCNVAHFLSIALRMGSSMTLKVFFIEKKKNVEKKHLHVVQPSQQTKMHRAAKRLMVDSSLCETTIRMSVIIVVIPIHFQWFSFFFFLFSPFGITFTNNEFHWFMTSLCATRRIHFHTSSDQKCVSSSSSFCITVIAICSQYLIYSKQNWSFVCHCVRSLIYIYLTLKCKYLSIWWILWWLSECHNKYVKFAGIFAAARMFYLIIDELKQFTPTSCNRQWQRIGSAIIEITQQKKKNARPLRLPYWKYVIKECVGAIRWKKLTYY